MKKKLKKPYIIAETACSHNGSLSILKKITKNVCTSGFDSIQFQIWKPSDVVTSDHKSISLLKKIYISKNNWLKIFKYTKKISKIEIIACIYSEDAFNFCYKNGIRVFKIHTSDLSNKGLLDIISKKAKRIDLSIGSSKFSEIQSAINVIKKNKCKIWLMYGLQLFPTNPKYVNLNFIKILKKKFKVEVGYQDHSEIGLKSFAICSLSIGSGTNIIEKHVTDFNSKNRIDGQSAIEIKDYKKFVNYMNLASECLGNKKDDIFNNAELRYRKYSKKSIYYNKDLFYDHKITQNDVFFARGNKPGLPLNNLNKILSKKISRNVKKDQPVTFEDFK
jgi:sialic acid synthase SpsE